MAEQRLPAVNGDDGAWGDILNQYISKEHYNTGLNNASNGGHKSITIRPGTIAAGSAPLKFTSGPLTTAPEVGAVEFLTDKLYLTQTTSTIRNTIAAYNDTSGATGDVYYRDSGANFVRLPVGNSTDVLTVDSGLPAWKTAVKPGGSDKQVQFNNNSALGGTAGFEWDGVKLIVPAISGLNTISGQPGALSQISTATATKTASTEYPYAYGTSPDCRAPRAFDNDTNTYHLFWGVASGYFLRVDFGAPTLVSRFKVMTTTNASGNNYYRGKYQGSNDAANWTDLATINDPPVNLWFTIDISTPASYRYYQFIVTDTNGWWYCVKEWQFWGPDLPTTTVNNHLKVAAGGNLKVEGDGSVCIGGTSGGAIGGTGMTGKLVVDTENGKPMLVDAALRRAENTTAALGAQFYVGRQRGTLAVPVVITSGDSLMDMYGYGFDGANYAYATSIKFTSEGTVGANKIPGRITLHTTDSAGTLTERVRIDSVGNVGIGGTANANAILDIASTTKAFMPPRMSTTQKSAIATPTAGMVIYDNVLNKLCVYTGAGWETITSS